MHLQRVTRSQQLAALKTLKEAIDKCPPEVWDARKDRDRLWFKAHHGLYWARLHVTGAGEG